MDNLEIAKALFGTKPQQPNGGQTTTTYGVAVSDSENGIVRVNLGGDTVSVDDDQTVEIETTFAVFEGDEVIVSLVGADGTGKAPCVIGVVGRGDQQQTEINSVINYVWNDNAGLHVSTQERSVQGANILLDSDSLDIRNGNSNSEADQTVYASFGKEVTVGSRASGTVGDYSQVFGEMCVAGGEYSHAEGCWTKATADFSHAEGKYTEATKDGTHAEGLNSVASGYCSHAEGYYTTASGNYAHAEGYQTTASGQFSHAEGSNSIAFSYYQHVQGESNVEDRVKKYADIIGNGNTDGQGNINRSNAYNMDWNGNAEFQGEVYVGGCTPNGETPYPVVRYNTSSSQSEYYNGSSWAQVPSGGGGGSTSVAITIAVSDWSSKTCTKAVTGVTSSNNIIVSPGPASFLAYGSAQIRATAQGSGTVTFACETVPAGSIDVNVLILG